MMSDAPSVMAPHQLRVVEEKRELDDKLSKLGSFMGSEKFLPPLLDYDERYRLARQYRVMHEYSAILGERIAAFEVPHA